MNSVESPPSYSLPNQYPQAIQLRLYQAFIFSIPILFSIILFLLFYLFYLKRRQASAPIILPTTTNDSSTNNITRSSDSDLKKELKNMMYAVLFDEHMKARDSVCCVCLGEFSMKEELVQVPLCKHIFHIDCIHYWLHKNSTCPLCRATVAPFPIKQFHSDHVHDHQVSIAVLQPQFHQCVTSEGSSSAGGVRVSRLVSFA